MASPEVALIARARGLGTHLLSRETLEALAEAPDLPALARGLSRLGAALEPVDETAEIEAIEQAVRRTAGRYLRILHRWQQHSPGVLDVFDADQDRRNLRALLRGAVQGAPVAARLTGLLPTPLLPGGVLAELARQPSPLAVVTLLTAMRHPDAEVLLPHVRRAQPELFAIEVALLAALSQRAQDAASRGDETLRQYVRERIDTGNIQNALLSAGRIHDVSPSGLYVNGGRWLSRQDFVKAAEAATPPAALAVLTATLAHTPLASTLPLLAQDAAHVERAFLIDTMRRLTHVARTNPLGSAPVLRTLLRIEAQSRDLRTVAWGAMLGTPPHTRQERLVTPWR